MKAKGAEIIAFWDRWKELLFLTENKLIVKFEQLNTLISGYQR